MFDKKSAFYNSNDSVALHGAEYGETYHNLYQKMLNYVLYVYHGWIFSRLDIILFYFSFLSTTLCFRQIGCHDNSQCIYEKALALKLLVYL